MTSARAEAHFIERMRLAGHTPRFVQCVLGYAAFPEVAVNRETVGLMDEAAMLAPPAFKRRLGVSDLVRMSRALATAATKQLPPAEWLADFSAWLKTGKEDEALKVWKARTKQDLAIRRTRMRDIWLTMQGHPRRDSVLELMRTAWQFDYITVMNCSWATLLVESMDWFGFWNHFGVFNGTFEEFAAITKEVNNLVKANELDGLDRMLIAESSCLVGYRNPPQPGFNKTDEARKLAEGGEQEHEIPGLVDFKETAREVLKMTPPVVEWISFHDYVVGRSWSTSGASSVGRVTVEVDGEQHEFKARKNLVADTYDLEQLYHECVESGSRQVSVAIVKSELAKLRIAVASDIYTYLKMSWVDRMLGHAYALWPGGTLDEPLNIQTDRMITMMRALCKRYGLPFDYAAFDHQPTLDELVDIVAILCDAASPNVPNEFITEFSSIVQDIVDGFRNGVLNCVDGDERSSFRVGGGLMSGLRWTSVIGNAWNTVITAMVFKLLRMMGIDVSKFDRWIRGDDSAIVTPSWAQALSVKLGYDALNVKAGVGKFGIHYEQMEFLRVWYKTDHLAGYLMRCIPGWTQRKPWSSRPWTETDTMSTLYDVRKTIIRRGGHEGTIERAWSTAKRLWSQHTRLPARLLGIPRVLGGYGVEPWDGKWVPSARAPTLTADSVKVLNLNAELRRDVLAEYSDLHIALTSDEVDVLSNSVAAGKVGADDIPSVNSALRSAFKKRCAGYRTTWFEHKRTEPIICDSLLGLEGKLGVWPGVYHAVRSELQKRHDLFGYYRKDLGVWRSLQALSSVRKHFRPMRELRRIRPGFADAIHRFESRGLSRGDAIDWLTGKVPHVVTTVVNSSLESVVTDALAACLSVSLKQRIPKNSLPWYVARVAPVLEHTVAHSSLSRAVYWW